MPCKGGMIKKWLNELAQRLKQNGITSNPLQKKIQDKGTSFD
jgi:hypothetical protein